MGLILLEAFAALAVLIFIVWWTMFSGRKKGEREMPHEAPKALSSAAPLKPPADAL